MSDQPRHTFFDPNSGKALEGIFPISARARSLLARSGSHLSFGDAAVRIGGAIEMITGLEHHCEGYRRFKADVVIKHLVKSSLLPGVDGEASGAMRHEVVAYLNRMGQFYSFARSHFVREKLGRAEKFLPSFQQLKIFRDKHVAHRSMDDPRSEERDDPSIAFDHALSLGIQAGRLHLKPEVRERFNAMDRELPKRPTARDWQRIMEFNDKLDPDDHEVIFEIVDASTKTYVTFSLERDHEAICSEAYRMLEALLASG